MHAANHPPAAARWLLAFVIVSVLAACSPRGLACYRYSVNRSLIRALDAEDVARVRSLLHRGASVQAHGRTTGFTPLHFMAWNNEPGAVEGLIGKGAPLEARDKDGYTPLTTAAIRGNAECLERLPAHGADPTATNDANQVATTRAPWMALLQGLSRKQNSVGKPGMFGEKRSLAEVEKGYERMSELLDRATRQSGGHVAVDIQ